MNALDWRKKFETPRLVHDNSGLVCAAIGERVIVFPCEASARFFVAACAELQNVADENDVLSQWIDEDALHAAQERVKALEAQVAELQSAKIKLESELGKMAEGAAKAARRARVLALALKNGITP